MTPETQRAPGARTITDERTELRLDDGDHERFAHYVAKRTLTEAMVMGTPVVALCGKVWQPSRDPGRFPLPKIQTNNFTDIFKIIKTFQRK